MPSGVLRLTQLESLLELLSGLEAQISFLGYHGEKIYSFHNDALIRYIDNGHLRLATAFKSYGNPSKRKPSATDRGDDLCYQRWVMLENGGTDRLTGVAKLSIRGRQGVSSSVRTGALLRYKTLPVIGVIALGHSTTTTAICQADSVSGPVTPEDSLEDFVWCLQSGKCSASALLAIIEERIKIPGHIEMNLTALSFAFKL